MASEKYEGKGQVMDKTLEILKSLAEASRAYWSGWDPDSTVQEGAEGYFEAEMVRAEDYLLKLEEAKTNADI